MFRYLYIVQSGAWFKIGYAENVSDRLVSLQSGNPMKLELYASYDFDTARFHARYYESKLHEIFKRQRGISEWFLLSSDDLDTIHRYCLAQGATPLRWVKADEAQSSEPNN